MWVYEAKYRVLGIRRKIRYNFIILTFHKNMPHPPENSEWENTPEIGTISKTSAQILAALVLRVSPEKYETIRNDLSPEQREALWEDALAHTLMIPDKVTNIGYMLSVTQIKSITPQRLAEISEDELNEIVMNS